MDLTDIERAALGYVAPRGIPLSVFLGRVVYPGDPQWTERDATAALWWKAEQDKLCGNCGQDLTESTAEGADFKFRAEGIWCHGCRAMYRESLAAAGKDPYGPDADPTVGMRFVFTKTPAMIEEVA